MEELMAHQELAQGGSLMARDEKPEWRKNLPNTLGPNLGTGVQTGMDLLDALLSFGPSPLDAAGGSGAQILPATWKAMAPEAKAMVTNFGNNYPKTFEKALASGPSIVPQVGPMPGGVNAYGMLRKPGDNVHQIIVRPDAVKRNTLGHELQHSLNAPRVGNTNLPDALTIATLLKDVNPAGDRGSLDLLLNKLIVPQPGRSLMQRIEGVATGTTPMVLNKKEVRAPLIRNAMDEGLAYTAQNAAKPNADPLLKLLAERLGVNWE